MAFAQGQSRPQALVYRGPATNNGLADSVATLLRSSPSNFQVEFVGPNEKRDVTPESLNGADLYAQPGGGDLAPAWKHTKQYKKAIRDYVSNGGRYAGFCLGAFLAGSGPGYDILPPGCNTDTEISQPGHQVGNEDDTVIQIDWTFGTGPRKGQKVHGRWEYFQDGAVMTLATNASAIVLARYTSNGDVAASVTPFGKGWVGAVGPHLEADETWYEGYNFTNPDGIDFDLGYDFVESIMAQPEPGTSSAHSQVDLRSQAHLLPLAALALLV